MAVPGVNCRVVVAQAVVAVVCFVTDAVTPVVKMGVAVTRVAIASFCAIAEPVTGSMTCPSVVHVPELYAIRTVISIVALVTSTVSIMEVSIWVTSVTV